MKANKTLVQKTPKICYSCTVQVQKFRIWLYGFIAKLNTEINLINMLTLQQNESDLRVEILHTAEKIFPQIL